MVEAVLSKSLILIHFLFRNLVVFIFYFMNYNLMFAINSCFPVFDYHVVKFFLLQCSSSFVF